MDDPINNHIDKVAGVAEQALLRLDRSERRIRRWTLVTAIAIFVASLMCMMLVFTYGTQQLNQIHKQQLLGQEQGQRIAQSLAILKQATSPAASHQAQLQTEQLIYCIINKVDYDTGKAAAVDPTCRAVTAKPTPPTAVKNTQGATGAQGATGSQGATGVTGATGSQGATGVTGATGSQGATGTQGLVGSPGPTGSRGPTGAVGAQGPAGKSAYPFSFTFNDGVKTYTCTVSGPTVGSCSSKLL